MPASGPVYQPTTVSYEQQEWSRPRGYLSEILQTVRSPQCIQWSLLVFGVFSIIIGLMMTAGVLFNAEVSTQNDTSSGNIIVAVCGFLIFVIGVLMVGVYVQLMRRRKGCSCFSKERRLTRDLHTQGGNGQIMTLNPSTDLLVASSTQYGPTSENPPAVTEEETHQLMSNDHKEVVDEHEHMLETDPRIVLRPLSKTEEA